VHPHLHTRNALGNDYSDIRITNQQSGKLPPALRMAALTVVSFSMFCYIPSVKGTTTISFISRQSAWIQHGTPFAIGCRFNAVANQTVSS